MQSYLVAKLFSLHMQNCSCNRRCRHAEHLAVCYVICWQNFNL